MTLLVDHVVATVHSEEFECLLHWRNISLRSMSPNWTVSLRVVVSMFCFCEMYHL